MKKIKKNFWEKIFAYPSFNLRFTSILLLVIFIFLGVAYYGIYENPTLNSVAETINAYNLLVQSATLVLGLLAAYYALRQLVETRAVTLNTSAIAEMGHGRYIRAYTKWKEAFYIEPDSDTFLNASESLLLAGEFEMFDSFSEIPEKPSTFQKNLIDEFSEELIFIQLKAVRHLLVENLGKAKDHIDEIVKQVQKKGLPKIDWNFQDLQTSVIYLELESESDSKKIGDNLVLYLQNRMPEETKEEFESGRYTYIKPEEHVQKTLDLQT